MKIEMYASSDIGLIRKTNEDNYLILKQEGVVVVCDGMGGHNAGDVASQMAVQTIETYFTRTTRKKFSHSSIPADLPDFARELITAIRLAGRRIFHDADANISHTGMGTTIAAIMLKENAACIAHIGDSRVYRIRNSELQQLTTDHTPFLEFSQENGFKMDESQSMGTSHIITRALGIRQATAIDIRLEEIEVNDTFLVCSDGLSGMVSDQVMGDILLHSDSMDNAISQLIDAANMAGGKDNITAAIACVRELDDVAPVLLTPGLVRTLPDEAPEIQRKEDKLITTLFGDPIDIPKNHIGWIKPGAALLFAAVAIILLLSISKRIPKETNEAIKLDEAKVVLDQSKDSLKTDSVIRKSEFISVIKEQQTKNITGHLSLEVYPVSDSIANSYDIAVDGNILSSFADLRQGGLVLSGGDHLIEVCVNGVVIYSNKVNVSRDGQKLEPLRLVSIIQTHEEEE